MCVCVYVYVCVCVRVYWGRRVEDRRVKIVSSIDLIDCGMDKG